MAGYKKSKAALLSGLLLAAVSAHAETPFEAGVQAYGKGDYTTARQNWEQALANGDWDAARNLGLLYRKGLGVETDIGRAAEYYRKAADHGIVNAQLNLAELYLSGQGVPKDLDRAKQLLKEAADHGSLPARFRLDEIQDAESRGTSTFALTAPANGKAAAQSPVRVAKTDPAKTSAPVEILKPAVPSVAPPAEITKAAPPAEDSRSAKVKAIVSAYGDGKPELLNPVPGAPKPVVPSTEAVKSEPAKVEAPKTEIAKQPDAAPSVPQPMSAAVQTASAAVPAPAPAPIAVTPPVAPVQTANTVAVPSQPISITSTDSAPPPKAEKPPAKAEAIVPPPPPRPVLPPIRKPPPPQIAQAAEAKSPEHVSDTVKAASPADIPKAASPADIPKAASPADAETIAADKPGQAFKEETADGTQVHLHVGSYASETDAANGWLNYNLPGLIPELTHVTVPDKGTLVRLFAVGPSEAVQQLCDEIKGRGESCQAP